MKKVLILHTGGTIGMNLKGSPEDTERFRQNIARYAPRVFETANVGIEILSNKDSSDMTPLDWVRLAEALHSRMSQWDGFVITHGTDTMSFTANALSFMLRNLTKPVILTGSQLPMEDSKSDGPRNLIHAVEIAAEARVHEVGVLFDSFLFRGNRCKKISIPSFRAFESPNFAPLAKLGVKIEYSDLHGPRGDYAFDPRIETRVLSIPLFPGIDVELLWSLTKNGVRGVVLQAFGPGDIPVSESSFVHWIRTLTERGIPTVICSQAVYGSVDLNLYETGRGARNVGAIGAGDMTWECSLVKMMILLGRGLPLAPFRAQFETSLAGELSK